MKLSKYRNAATLLVKLSVNARNYQYKFTLFLNTAFFEYRRKIHQGPPNELTDKNSIKK
jgi:competence transcription factor ComK